MIGKLLGYALAYSFAAFLTALSVWGTIECVFKIMERLG